MAHNSVDAPAPPEQRLLGEYRPTSTIRLTLLVENGEILLVRPSAGSRAGTAEDIAAFISRNGDVVDVEWSQWHVQHQPVWMGAVEDWIRHLLESES